MKKIIERGLSSNPEHRHPSLESVADKLRAARLSRRRWRTAAVAAAVAGAGLSGAMVFRAPQVKCDTGDALVAAPWNDARRQVTVDGLRAQGVLGSDVAVRVVPSLDDYAKRWASAHRAACERTHVAGDQSPELLDLRFACLGVRLSAFESVVETLARADAKVAARARNLVAALPRIDDCADTVQLLRAVPDPDDPGLRRAVQESRRRIAAAAMLVSAGNYERAQAVAREVRESQAAAHRPLLARALYLEAAATTAARQPGARRALLDAIGHAEATRLDEIAARGWWKVTVSAKGDEASLKTANEDIERFAAAVSRLGNPPEFVTALHGARGRLAQLSGEYEDAALHFAEGLSVARKTGEPIRAASLALDLANTRYQQGDYPAAEKEFRALVSTYEDLYGPSHHHTSRAVANLATTLIAMGQHDQALPLLERSLAAKRATLRADHPRIAIGLNSLGSAHYRLGDFERALALFEEAVEIRESSAGPEDPKLADPLGNVARALSALGRDEEAIAAARRAVAIRTAASGEEHSAVASQLAALGTALGAAGRWDTALQTHKRALKIRRDRLGADHVETGYSMHSVADALRRVERWDEGAKYADQAIQILSARLGVDHAQTAAALLTGARIDLQRGRQNQSRERAIQANAIYQKIQAPDEAEDEAANFLASLQ